MKNLYLVGGTMGVGKSAACRAVQQLLPACVFLDGDWCWNAHPWIVTDETKRLVLDNITHLLRSFIECSAYENIVFCWVMHRQEIINELLRRQDLSACRVRAVSLVCTPEALRTRLEKDIAAGRRTPDVIERSLAYLPLYGALDTVKIDVSHLTIQETACRILSVSP